MAAEKKVSSALDPTLMLSPKERKGVSASTRRTLNKAAADIARSSKDSLKKPILSAHESGLHYVSPDALTIERRKNGKHFTFTDPRGKPIKDKKTLERVQHLAIPPAWKDVKIATDAKAHLQAIGIDARGRKQYLYHPMWRTVRDMTKFHHVIPFGSALPRIREQIATDLRKAPLSRENVLATVVSLIDQTYIRVGNEEYAKENKSYGITTMQDRHASVRGDSITFNFRGKSSKMHKINVHDTKLAKIVRLSQELPGQHLFQYIDPDGNTHNVTSTDINDYLAKLSDMRFTAKDFRTWAGTVYAALDLAECDDVETMTIQVVRQNIMQAMENVSGKLGNTPSICRKSYVHPIVIQSYEAKVLSKKLQAHRGKKTAGLSAGEATVLEFLKECDKAL